MASELAAYYVSIVASAKGIQKSVGKELAGVDREAEKAGKSSGGAFSGAFKAGMAGIAGAFAAAGIGSFISDAVKGAGDLQQSVGAIESVFGKSSKQMASWSKDAATNVGLTQNEFNELGTLIGSQLKNGGTAMDQLAPKTNELITLGADLSSMFGGSAKDAVDALSSALKGERDPIEKYGVSLNQAKIDAEAAALGFEKVDGALSAEATQAATMSLIMKQTSDAHGNFAKESDTFAHKQQVAAARWGDLTTKIGDVFLPVFSKVIGFFSDKAMPVLTTVVGGVEAFGAAFKANDGDITSKGFAGTMERMAFGAHKLFDSIKTAVAPIATLFATAFSTLGPAFAPLIPQIITLVTSFSPLGILLKSLAPVLPQIAGLLTVLGKALAGSLAQILPTVTSLISSLVGTMSGVLVQIMPVVVSLVKSLAGALAQVMPVVAEVIKAIAPLVATLIGQLAPIITDLITAILPPLIGLFMNIVAAILPLVSTILAMLVPAIQFLMPLVKFAFGVIANVIKVALGIAIAIIGSVVKFVREVLGPVFNWLWTNVIKPVFGFIGAAISFWWNNIVMPVFQAVWGFLKNTLGPVFDWLWKTIIKPVWDGIGSAIKTVWEKVVKPVFDTLGKFIKETIPKAFDTGVKAIKTAWDAIQEIAKAPVRFVVNTVINDGLIAGFNALATPLGVKPLGKVALPPGFANGGYTGPGGKYQPAGIVHAGEYVFTKEQTRRAGVGNLAAMAQSLNGYARGGIVNPLKQMALTQGYNRVHKGIDLAAAVGTPVFATQSGRVSWAGPGVQAPGVWGGNEIHVLGNGIETWFAHLSSIGVKLGDQVRAGQQIGLSGNTGITSGPHLHFGTFAGGWPNDIDPLAYLGGAGIPSGGGFNPIQGIIDGLMSKIREAGGGPFADIAIGIGKKVIDSASKFVTDFLSGNRDKGSATATLFDGGGWLENTGGAQLVQHNKRKPDAVLSSSQWDTMTRIADNAKGGFVNHGTIHVRDENEMARIIMTRQRDAQAAYGF